MKTSIATVCLSGGLSEKLLAPIRLNAQSRLAPDPGI